MNPDICSCNSRGFIHSARTNFSLFAGRKTWHKSSLYLHQINSVTFPKWQTSNYNERKTL